MKSVYWFETAENDLEEIYNFYLPKSTLAAINIYNSIIEEVQRLASWSDIAPLEPLGKGKKYPVRTLVACNGLFKIIYFVAENEIFITRIWCCRKNPADFRIE